MSLTHLTAVTCRHIIRLFRPNKLEMLILMLVFVLALLYIARNSSNRILSARRPQLTRARGFLLPALLGIGLCFLLLFSLMQIIESLSIFHQNAVIFIPIFFFVCAILSMYR